MVGLCTLGGNPLLTGTCRFLLKSTPVVLSTMFRPTEDGTTTRIFRQTIDPYLGQDPWSTPNLRRQVRVSTAPREEDEPCGGLQTLSRLRQGDGVDLGGVCSRRSGLTGSDVPGSAGSTCCRGGSASTGLRDTGTAST